MADHQDAHAAAPAVEAHGTADADGDGDHDAHGHAGGEVLGPIDVTAWGAAILGIALGLVVMLALLLAVS